MAVGVGFLFEAVLYPRHYTLPPFAPTIAYTNPPWVSSANAPAPMHHPTCTHHCTHHRVCLLLGGGNGGAVRLVAGSSSAAGTVQICKNGMWGTVCDEGWDDTDASTVCRYDSTARLCVVQGQLCKSLLGYNTQGRKGLAESRGVVPYVRAPY
jgi:hypothetical protein